MINIIKKNDIKETQNDVTEFHFFERYYFLFSIKI